MSLPWIVQKLFVPQMAIQVVINHSIWDNYSVWGENKIIYYMYTYIYIYIHYIYIYICICMCIIIYCQKNTHSQQSMPTDLQLIFLVWKTTSFGSYMLKSGFRSKNSCRTGDVAAAKCFFDLDMLSQENYNVGPPNDRQWSWFIIPITKVYNTYIYS